MLFSKLANIEASVLGLVLQLLFDPWRMPISLKYGCPDAGYTVFTKGEPESPAHDQLISFWKIVILGYFVVLSLGTYVFEPMFCQLTSFPAQKKISLYIFLRWYKALEKHSDSGRTLNVPSLKSLLKSDTAS